VKPITSTEDRALDGSPGGASTVVVERDVEVPMRDGTVLRADVWRSARGEPAPVLLQRSPYGKNLGEISIVHAGLDPLQAVEAGYAVVFQDTRGRCASDGEFTPFAHEADDGADTLAWLAEQPFSNGRTGMYGGSYFGATQLLAAARRPPGLHAIAPVVTASEYYDGWTYQGGAFQLGFVQHWTLLGLAPVVLQRLPEADRRQWQPVLDDLLADPWALYRRLPLDDLDGLEELLPFYLDWLEHDTRDEWWRATAPNDRYGEIAVPALHVGGWYDLFAAGTLENFSRLRREAATEEARAGQRLVMGPWSHGSYGDTIGDLQFGLGAVWGGGDTTAFHLAWFDRHLREVEVDDGPPVRLFLMGANRWLDEDDWPVRGVVDEHWYLRSGGGANTLAGDGVLSRRGADADEPADAFVYDPRDPVPTHGGASFVPGYPVGFRTGPHDQRELEARPDVLVYTSDPLPEDLDVIGPVEATLHVSTSAPDTDFTAKLVDVHPDGRAYGICDGILALRHRDGLERAEHGTAGEVYELRIALGPTANRFLAGHRLRLEVSSSNFPRFARTPNDGTRPTQARASNLTTARQQVFHDRARPSHLSLPVRR
jgi:putative CocE/NonD family hydrolase